MPCSRELLIAVVLMVIGGFPLRVAAQAEKRAIDCPEIVSFSNRLTHEAPKKSHDPIYIGHRLRVNAYLVERCLLANGRRVTRHVMLDEETKEQLEDRWETKAGEVFGEDTLPESERGRRKVPKAEESTGWEGVDFRQGQNPPKQQQGR